MAKQKTSSGVGQAELEVVKRATLTALVTDDGLTDRLVLKGGSALEMIYGVSDRSSIDLDFSMSNTFAAEELGPLRDRIESLLSRSLGEIGLHALDVKLQPRPKKLTADIADFWGGHELSFKVISKRVAESHADLDQRRNRAIQVGAGGRASFSVDISSFEHVESRTEQEVDGYTVFVYSPAMIVAEKLRALCQQMVEYAPVVKRAGRPGAPRARDFLDIFSVVEQCRVDTTTPEHLDLVQHTFAAKKVPLHLLQKIRATEDFHRISWPSVQDTVLPSHDLQPFETYFAFVVELARQLTAALPGSEDGG
ncbi:nucleotidyl transferase AbiEii/AbiGii toxin family protein [Phycisphaera mikurensis]|nr:nucleotidyl transferase AbiEii/AbiGii toxin family protein [Phycisphaera mikurensis]MBB6443166.1 hypothetical protein [Phycisphaera mikurensis]